MESKGRIFDIIRASFVDGPGIRTSVFLKGCNLNCAWCHNPEGKNPKPQLMFYADKCSHCGKCAEVCPNELKSCTLCGRCAVVCPSDARRICGREISSEELLDEIKKDAEFYKSSGGGVTFSGGECMLQIDFLAEMLEKCKSEKIETAVDTAGNVPWSYFERILPYTDLFLYDIKSMKSEVHLKYVGADNELILENLGKLLRRGARVWIRIPIIPEVNDGDDDMLAVREFLKPCSPEKIELLPYHAMGENKYAAIGSKTMKFSVPSKEKICELKKTLTKGEAK